MSIVCKDLVKIYKTGKVEVVALRGLYLTVEEGEIRAIVGPSGSGKTTLLNIIGGVDRPSAGKVIVDGIDLTTLTDAQLVEYRRKRVGFVFQFFNLVPNLTALENVELPMAIAGVPRSQRHKRAMELLALVGLEDRAHHKPDELSGGEQQRVAIAAALANDPPIILADEPTGELDTKTSRQVAQLFKQLNGELGKTIIIVTHDLAIATIAHKISRIEDGVIVSTVTPAELEAVGYPAGEKLEEKIRRLEERRTAIEEEMKKLEADYKAGKISSDEFVKRYAELKSALDRVEEEIKRYTLV